MQTVETEKRRCIKSMPQHWSRHRGISSALACLLSKDFVEPSQVLPPRRLRLLPKAIGKDSSRPKYLDSKFKKSFKNEAKLSFLNRVDNS